jgi:Na+-driven multidrug efflux pump
MNIIGFYVFGLPIGLSLMLKTSLELHGFWIGLLVGDVVLITMQIIYVYRINWTEEAEKVKELLKHTFN